MHPRLKELIRAYDQIQRYRNLLRHWQSVYSILEQQVIAMKLNIENDDKHIVKKVVEKEIKLENKIDAIKKLYRENPNNLMVHPKRLTKLAEDGELERLGIKYEVEETEKIRVAFKDEIDKMLINEVLEKEEAING